MALSRSKVHAQKQNGQAGVQADYIDGDPVEPGPINDGTLAIDRGGLHFRGAPGQAELRIAFDDLQGMTVSGARANGRSSGRRHGTTRVAAYRDQMPTVWQFAIDRSKAVLLRERVNRALAGMGRSPLPFVEALYDFELPVPATPVARPGSSDHNGGARISRRNGAAASPARPRRPAKIYRQRSRQSQIIFAVVGAVVAAEIIATLLVLFVF